MMNTNRYKCGSKITLHKSSCPYLSPPCTIFFSSAPLRLVSLLLFWRGSTRASGYLSSLISPFDPRCFPETRESRATGITPPPLFVINNSFFRGGILLIVLPFFCGFRPIQLRRFESHGDRSFGRCADSEGNTLHLRCEREWLLRVRASGQGLAFSVALLAHLGPFRMMSFPIKIIFLDRKQDGFRCSLPPENMKLITIWDQVGSLIGKKAREYVFFFGDELSLVVVVVHSSQLINHKQCFLIRR